MKQHRSFWCRTTISRTERHYREDNPVLIRRETFVGQPQVTEAVAHVDEKVTLRDVRTVR